MHSFIIRAAVTAVSGLAASSALASVPIFGGPTYDSTTGTGYQFPDLPFAPGSTAGNGTAVGTAEKKGGGFDLGGRAVRWDASGAAATELGTLSTSGSGFTISRAVAINTAGTVVGSAYTFSGNTVLGFRAVRWDASGTAATELGNLGTSSGFTNSEAVAINTAGTTVGFAHKYGGNEFLGDRAVRWDASGTAATELGNLGTNSAGETYSRAVAINTVGTAVGYASKYSGATFLGNRAVRWDASGTAATELGNLGTNSAGGASSQAVAINTAGTTVGFASKHSGATFLGDRAVRWDASGTAATELGNLGTSSAGETYSQAFAVNTVGTAVGHAAKFSGNTFLGTRAVRWDASGTAATELGNLGTNSVGVTSSQANAINSAGTAVGWAIQYSGGTDLGFRAVAWGLDGVAIDLNTLLAPADTALWTLNRASGISDSGWITGIGIFDPDGAAGPLGGYERAFLVQIPEPSTVALLAFGAIVTARRCR